MRLSTKTRYGTRALVDLASHQKGQTPVPLKEIAERQEISLNYLEHIVTPLIASGILTSLRGTKGGISLARPTREITLKEVVEVLEGPTALVECINHPQKCSRSGSCATKDLWGEIKNAMDGVLASTTLQDLVERQNLKDPGADMYFI